MVKEVAIGLPAVIWFEWNAEIVTLAAPTWSCRGRIHVCCANVFWFGSHLDAFRFGGNGNTFLRITFSLVFSKDSKLLCSDLQFKFTGFSFGLRFRG